MEGDTAQCMFKYYHTRTRPVLSANELGPFPLALQIFCVALARNKWAGWHCAFHIYLPLRPLFLTIKCFCRGFGHYMSDSAMVIMWPSRDAADADGSYSSVTLSQRKAPYETMPTPDLDPPFVATLDLAETSVRPPPSSLSKSKAHDAQCSAFFEPWLFIRSPGRLRWHSPGL